MASGATGGERHGHDCTSEEELEAHPTSDLRHRRPSSWTKALGLSILLGCVLAAAVAGLRRAPPDRDDSRLANMHDANLIQKDGVLGMHSALGMLTNPEVHSAATANIMRVGDRLLKPEDGHLVRASVATGFLNISSQIHLRLPALAKELVLMTLTDEQKDAVIAALKLTSEPELVSVGERVGKVIHEAGTLDQMVLRHLIEDSLRSQTQDIWKLRKALLPAHLQAALDYPSKKDYRWALSLDSENVRVMSAYAGGKFVSLKATPTVPGVAALSELATARKTYGVLGGVLEQGRVLVNILKSIGRLRSNADEIPVWVTELGGNMDVSSQDLNCEHHFASDSKLTFMKQLLCPLKFGTQGLDAISSVPENIEESQVLM